jgi:hypothetical protein
MHTETHTDIATQKLRLLGLPAALHEARQALRAAQDAVTALKGAVADAEAEMLMEVTAATDEAGKVKFTNEATRKAEVRRRLGSDPLHRDRAKALADAETDAFSAQLAVQRLEDEHRAARAVADLTIAEIELLVHGR